MPTPSGQSSIQFLVVVPDNLKTCLRSSLVGNRDDISNLHPKHLKCAGPCQMIQCLFRARLPFRPNRKHRRFLLLVIRGKAEGFVQLQGRSSGGGSGSTQPENDFSVFKRFAIRRRRGAIRHFCSLGAEAIEPGQGAIRKCGTKLRFGLPRRLEAVAISVEPLDSTFRKQFRLEMVGALVP